MNKPMSVKELKVLCNKEILKGNGDKVIMISSDDECNNYHYLWGSFLTVEEHEKPFIYQGKQYQFDFEYCDESVAKKEDTITLI